jgi:hypothetical protein
MLELERDASHVQFVSEIPGDRHCRGRPVSGFGIYDPVVSDLEPSSS